MPGARVVPADRACRCEACPGSPVVKLPLWRSACGERVLARRAMSNAAATSAPATTAPAAATLRADGRCRPRYQLPQYRMALRRTLCRPLLTETVQPSRWPRTLAPRRADGRRFSSECAALHPPHTRLSPGEAVA